MDRYAKLIEDMNNHALRDYPLEACGVILKDLTYEPCKNLSDYPKETFILDPAVLLNMMKIFGEFFIHIPVVTFQFLVKTIKLVLHFKSINF